MAVYLTTTITLKDMEKFQDYATGARPTIAAHGGEPVMIGELPVTIITAIVSPTARPSPSSAALRIPDFAPVRTMRIDSHCVAPSASAASRCESGMDFITSREMEVMMGRIMIVRITIAAIMPNP